METKKNLDVENDQGKFTNNEYSDIIPLLFHTCVSQVSAMILIDGNVSA